MKKNPPRTQLRRKSRGQYSQTKHTPATGDHTQPMNAQAKRTITNTRKEQPYHMHAKRRKRAKGHPERRNSTKAQRQRP